MRLHAPDGMLIDKGNTEEKARAKRQWEGEPV